jgi:hypothetical protein
MSWFPRIIGIYVVGFLSAFYLISAIIAASQAAQTEPEKIMFGGDLMGNIKSEDDLMGNIELQKGKVYLYAKKLPFTFKGNIELPKGDSYLFTFDSKPNRYPDTDGKWKNVDSPATLVSDQTIMWYASPVSTLTQDNRYGRTTRVTGISPGTGAVWCRSDWKFKNASGEFIEGSMTTIWRVVVKEEAPPEVIFSTGSIQGKVAMKGTGEPVDGAKISLLGNREYTTDGWITDKYGVFLLDLSEQQIPEGRYRIAAHKFVEKGDLWQSNEVVLDLTQDKAQEGIEVGLVEMEFIPLSDRFLDSGILRGKVVMIGTGTPVAGAIVELIKIEDGNMIAFDAWMNGNGCGPVAPWPRDMLSAADQSNYKSYRWLTDEQGRFEIDVARDIPSCMKEGLYQIQVHKPSNDTSQMFSVMDDLWPVRDYREQITVEKMEKEIDAGTIELDSVENVTT